MKRVLILSYFFPPSNFVANKRIKYWVENLHHHNIYPTIITRQWNPNQTDLTDKIHENELIHEKNERFEIYRLPYHQNLRDKLNNRQTNSLLIFLRKTLTFLELILQNFFISAIPYHNLFSFTKQLVQKEKFDLLIVSGRPFQLFYFANRLHKQTGIKWLADYRDEWNTFQNQSHQNSLMKWISKLESKSELKWTANCAGFITVSETWKDSISQFISKKGHVVMNGYNQKSPFCNLSRKLDKDKIVISYIGSLYPSQPIQAFLKALHFLKDVVAIEINFIGINVVPNQKERVNQLSKDLGININVIDRIPEQELLSYYKKSDFLLLTPFENIKGWYPVKVFEYASTQIPILLYPSDSGVLEKFIEQCQCGHIISNEKDLKALFLHTLAQKNKGEIVSLTDLDMLQKYSRSAQLLKLKEVIEKYV